MLVIVLFSIELNFQVKLQMKIYHTYKTFLKVRRAIMVFNVINKHF